MGDVTKLPFVERQDRGGDAVTSPFSLVLSFPKRPASSAMNADDVAAYNAAIEEKLGTLRQEHRALDQALEEAEQSGPLGRLEAMRLKKRKLVLKDAITQLSAKVLPDIIA